MRRFPQGKVPVEKRVLLLISDPPVSSQRFGGSRRSYVSRGEHNKLIARLLNLSQRTVEAQITSMLNKMGFNNRTQLARWRLEMSSPVAIERI